VNKEKWFEPTHTHTHTHEDTVFARIRPSCRHCLRTY